MASFLTPFCALAAGHSCAPHLLAEAPLRDDLGFLSAPVSVNGRTISLVVDTGSEGSLISPDFAREMALPTDPLRSTRLAGPGGDGGVAPNVIARSLRIGGLELGPVSLPMGFLPARPNIHPPVEGLLGGDLLSGDGAVLWHPPALGLAGGGRIDALELDASGGRMAFWTKGAADACEQPPHVEGGWTPLPATRRGRRIVLKIRLDGHDLTALLDSGARSRIVSEEAAAALGVTKDALERDSGGTTAGVDGRASIYRWHRFHSLTIGGETELNPVLTVARVSEPVNMLLGSDWFAQRRVWISYRDGRVFVANARKASSGR